jgi:hypothetical protein
MKNIVKNFMAIFLMLKPFTGLTQGTFQNLNFESADVPSSPLVLGFNYVPIGSALPGWTGYLGSDQQTQVLYNSPLNSTASIILIGPTWNGSDVGLFNGVGIIDGNYSVDLQTGASLSNILVSENASIAQNGTVPATAQSLLFEACETTPLSVSFNGNLLSPVALSSGVSPDGVNYSVYAANISARAGQTGELEFTADFNGSYNFVVLDDISFSPNSVPEPSTWALMLLAGAAFGVRRWRAKSSSKSKS